MPALVSVATPMTGQLVFGALMLLVASTEKLKPGVFVKLNAVVALAPVPPR